MADLDNDLINQLTEQFRELNRIMILQNSSTKSGEAASLLHTLSESEKKAKIDYLTNFKNLNYKDVIFSNYYTFIPLIKPHLNNDVEIIYRINDISNIFDINISKINNHRSNKLNNLFFCTINLPPVISSYSITKILYVFFNTVTFLRRYCGNPPVDKWGVINKMVFIILLLQK